MVKITGTISCEHHDLAVLQTLLDAHVLLSRSEPGCLEFSITPSKADPCVFDVRELFVDQAAFETHTARTRASVWWERTSHIPRELRVSKA